jgi:hypothetical protein
MYFRTLGLTLLIVSQVSFAYGRKPAVEDFVGIEVDHPEGTPQGTESLFNFEKQITKFDPKKVAADQPVVAATPVKAEGPSGLATVLTILFVLGLPGIIWSVMMNRLRQKAHIESASNIEVLEKYRRERQEAKKAQDEIKKVA